VVSGGRRRRDSYGHAYTESQQGDVLVAVVDVVHYRHGCFARPACP
jgi:hypothetical protein